MGDLISREAVIDVLKQTGIIQDNDLGHLIVEEINRIPVAYDKERVLEQITYRTAHNDCRGCKRYSGKDEPCFYDCADQI